MKETSRCFARLAVLLALAGGEGIGFADDVVIQSFDGSGRLQFNTLINATNYQVQWAASPAGPWANFSGAAGAWLDNIPATQAGCITCSVPMCYRVLAWVTNVYDYGLENWTSSTTPSDWVIDSGVLSAQESNTVHGGSYSLRLTRNTTNNSDTDVAVAAPDYYPVTEGSVYTLTLWYWDMDAYARSNLNYTWLGADRTTIIGATYYGSSYTVDSPAWQSITRDTVAAPAGAAFLCVSLRVYSLSGGMGTIIVDDLSIVPK